MDAVAGEAGVSKQTVYSHFGDKESLFAACVEDKIAQYNLEDLDDLLALDMRAALVQLCGRFLDLLMDPEVIGMFRLIISISGEHPDMGQLFYRNGPERTTRLASAVLEAHRKNGVLALDDPLKAAGQLVDLLVGHHHRQLLLGVPADLPVAERAAHIEQTVDLFMRMYAP